jgi:uroporphyrinogen decarboxylase
MTMSKRDVVRQALEFQPVSYVPWQFTFTEEAEAKLRTVWPTGDLDEILGNHLLLLGSQIGFFEELENNRVRDVFGVVWDRSEDKDIGMVEGQVLGDATLGGYTFPDPLDARFFGDIPEKIAASPDRYRVFCLGFSLFERAWTLRGMETLMMDFFDAPEFVSELMEAIADYNIAQVKKALEYDIDAVYFGDDWGQQHGLMMGKPAWDRFIAPQLERMYSVVRDAGKKVFIHSCGDVRELFDDLHEFGLNCFNPFQPEVMDVEAIFEKYRGRLAFHGGLSTQKTLPYGSADEVRAESARLLAMGQNGGYIFSPAHAVEGDVPTENLLAFIEAAKNQPNAPR